MKDMSIPMIKCKFVNINTNMYKPAKQIKMELYFIVVMHATQSYQSKHKASSKINSKNDCNDKLKINKRFFMWLYNKKNMKTL